MAGKEWSMGIGLWRGLSENTPALTASEMKPLFLTSGKVERCLFDKVGQGDAIKGCSKVGWLAVAGALQRGCSNVGFLVDGLAVAVH